MAYSTGAATTASGGYTVRLDANAYYEVMPGYTGRLAAIMSAGTGALSVTEVVA